MRVQNLSYYPHIRLTVICSSGDIHISLHPSPSVIRRDALYTVTSCPEYAIRDRRLYKTLLISMAERPMCLDDMATYPVPPVPKGQMHPVYHDLPPVISPESFHPKITDLEAIIATLASSHCITTLVVQGVAANRTLAQHIPEIVFPRPVEQAPSLGTYTDLTSRLLTTLTHLTLVRICASLGDTPLAITRATVPSSIRAVVYVTVKFTPVDAHVLYALTDVATHVARCVTAVAPAPGPSLRVTYLSLVMHQHDDPNISYLNTIINEYPSLKLIDPANLAGLKSIPAHFETDPTISHPTLERVFGLEYQQDYSSRLPRLLSASRRTKSARAAIKAAKSYPFCPATSYISQYLPVVVHPRSRWKSKSQIRFLRFAHLFASFLLASLRIAPDADPCVVFGVLRHFTSLDGLKGPEEPVINGHWMLWPRR